MKLRGRLIVNILDNPETLEPQVVLEAEGNVMAMDALIGFGKMLDRVINGPVPMKPGSAWRRDGEVFRAAVERGQDLLREAPDERGRADRQAGLIRAVVDNILQNSMSVVLVRGSHVDS